MISFTHDFPCRMDPAGQKQPVMTVRERVRRCRAKKKGQHVERVRKGKHLTSAEKMKRHRAKKMKNDPTYYQSELKRVEDLRKEKVKNMTPIQLKAYQKAVAVRKQKSRKNIKKKLTGNRGNGGENHDDNVGYKSPQGSSVASPICQEGQSKRNFPIFAFSSRFFLFFPDFSKFPPIFPLFSRFFGNFFAVRGDTLPPLPPQWLRH